MHCWQLAAQSALEPPRTLDRRGRRADLREARRHWCAVHSAAGL